MKKFEVRLWRDEASAYAISAISKYLEEEYQRGENDENVLKQALKEGGFFMELTTLGEELLISVLEKCSRRGKKTFTVC